MLPSPASCQYARHISGCKDGFTRWNWNSALAPPATTPLWYCTSYITAFRVDGPRRPILWQAASVCPPPCSSLDTLQSPATVSEGTRKRMSNIHSRAFKFPVNLFHWMQSRKIHWPQPAFFSVLLLILAVQCSAVFAVMQERASCRCHFCGILCVEFSMLAPFTVRSGRAGDVKVKHGRSVILC